MLVEHALWPWVKTGERWLTAENAWSPLLGMFIFHGLVTHNHMCPFWILLLHCKYTVTS